MLICKTKELADAASAVVNCGRPPGERGTVTITHTQELLFHAADRQPADNVFLQHQIDYRNRQCHQQRHGRKMTAEVQFVKIVQAGQNRDMEV